MRACEVVFFGFFPPILVIVMTYWFLFPPLCGLNYTCETAAYAQVTI